MIAAGAAQSAARGATTGPGAMFATTRSAAGSSPVVASRTRASSSTPFAAALARVDLDRDGIVVDGCAPGRGRAAQRRSRARRSRSRRRAALPRGPAGEQLDAEPRRRVRTGAERAARVDHDRRQAPRSGVSQGGPIQRPPTDDRPVERRANGPPSPLSTSAALAPPNGLPEPLLAVAARVRDQLDRAVALGLLEALGKELDHARARLLGPLGGDGDGDAAEDAQRNALLSRSKKPSSSSCR